MCSRLLSFHFSHFSPLLFRLLRLLLPLTIGLALNGCSQKIELPIARAAEVIDFSGHWEKNYQASDDLNTKFQLFLFDVQRSINTDSQTRTFAGTTGGVSGDALLGLAQLTEDITKVSLLEIEQDEDGIFIDREDNFALTCDYFTEQFVTIENPFGTEICGWNGGQLIFQFILNDGLRINHQVTMGPDQQQLNITTTISSSAVSSGFTISNYFQRYSPPEYDFDCIFTLSRNNVCSQGGS